MNSATVARRLVIAGRVQGVGYRAWAVEAALWRGLRGWVRNTRDGRVETLLIGPASAVDAMVAACRRGPPAARVTGLEVGEAEDDGSTGFTPRPTA